MLIDPRADEHQKHYLSRGEKIAVVVISLAVIIALLLIGSKARAAEPACPWDADCISWNYDAYGGTPTGIMSHRIETAKVEAGPWTALTVVTMPALSYKRQPVSGTNYYRIFTNYEGGSVAGPSVTANSTVVLPVPALKIVNNIGYQLNLGSNNRIYFSRVGTVPLDKECIVGMNVMDKHVIKSRDWLTLDPGKTSQPRQVFALCKAG